MKILPIKCVELTLDGSMPGQYTNCWTTGVIIVMTASRLKTGVEPACEMLCVSDVPQTVDSVHHGDLTYIFIDFHVRKLML
jgi:hypothetical protein